MSAVNINSNKADYEGNRNVTLNSEDGTGTGDGSTFFGETQASYRYDIVAGSGVSSQYSNLTNQTVATVTTVDSKKGNESKSLIGKASFVEKDILEVPKRLNRKLSKKFKADVKNSFRRKSIRYLNSLIRQINENEAVIYRVAPISRLKSICLDNISNLSEDPLEEAYCGFLFLLLDIVTSDFSDENRLYQYDLFVKYLNQDVEMNFITLASFRTRLMKD